MLMIRLQRTGRSNMRTYRIVVLEKARSTKSGRIVEQIGSYNSKTKERTVKADRVKYWMSVGAQPTGTMHNMLITLGILSGKKINVLPQKTPPKKEGAEVVAESPAVAA